MEIKPQANNHFLIKLNDGRVYSFMDTSTILEKSEPRLVQIDSFN